MKKIKNKTLKSLVAERSRSIKSKILLTLTASLSVISFSACCFLPSGEEKLDLSNYKLVWSDEFAESSLDTDYWSREVWNAGKVNNEVQSYTASDTNLTLGAETSSSESSSSKLSTDGSTLKINAVSTNGQTWTSARINTSGKVSIKYGYIEARLKMPVAYDASGNVCDNTGVWPAFWMMPENAVDSDGNETSGGVYGVWPRSGEIDILEYSPGTTGQKVYSTLHHAASKTDATDTYPSLGSKTFENPYEWHTYGLFWTSGTIEAFYDGVSLGSVYANPGNNWANWPYDQNFYIILNLAMGGNLGGAINSEMRKAVYEVDYVRVYQNENCSIKFAD